MNMMQRTDMMAEAAAKRHREKEQEHKRRLEEQHLLEDLLEVVDEEIYDHNRELTWGMYDRRKVRKAVLRQMAKQALAGMNSDHFSDCEAPDDD